MDALTVKILSNLTGMLAGVLRQKGICSFSEFEKMLRATGTESGDGQVALFFSEVASGLEQRAKQSTGPVLTTIQGGKPPSEDIPA